MKYCCDVCGKVVSQEEIHSFYPEDDSFICEMCFNNTNCGGGEGRQ